MEIKKDEISNIKYFDNEKVKDAFLAPTDEDVFREEPLVKGLIRIHFLENYVTVLFVRVEGGSYDVLYPGGNLLNSDYHAKKLLGYVHYVMIPRVNNKSKKNDQ